MKRKPIHVDWDELEAAFENRSQDLTYYLDLVTGQVILEGEGEDAQFDDDSEIDSAVDPEAAPRREPTRLYVESFSLDDELDWMDEFIEGDEGMSQELKDKLGDFVAKTDGNAFKDEMRHHAEIRDRWFLFRTERLHEVMDAWIEAHHVIPATNPPWK